LAAFAVVRAPGSTAAEFGGRIEPVDRLARTAGAEITILAIVVAIAPAIGTLLAGGNARGDTADISLVAILPVGAAGALLAGGSPLLIDATGFGFPIAARSTGAGVLIADLAGIAAVAIAAARSIDMQINAGAPIGPPTAAGGVARAANVAAFTATRADILGGTTEIRIHRSAVTDRVTTAIDQTAIVVVGTAFRPGIGVANAVRRRDRRFARAAIVGRTAQLFSIAGAVATGVVTTF
jgi:hypothetical protein